MSTALFRAKGTVAPDCNVCTAHGAISWAGKSLDRALTKARLLCRSSQMATTRENIVSGLRERGGEMCGKDGMGDGECA